jgi:hypothetical protein
MLEKMPSDANRQPATTQNACFFIKLVSLNSLLPKNFAKRGPEREGARPADYRASSQLYDYTMSRGRAWVSRIRDPYASRHTALIDYSSPADCALHFGDVIPPIARVSTMTRCGYNWGRGFRSDLPRSRTHLCANGSARG